MLADKRCPSYVECVTIAVDDDEAGLCGAYDLAQRLENRGIKAIMYETSAEREGRGVNAKAPDAERHPPARRRFLRIYVAKNGLSI